MLCLMKMWPAALAQSVEHLTRNEKVISSILIGGSVLRMRFANVFFAT